MKKTKDPSPTPSVGMSLQEYAISRGCYHDFLKRGDIVDAEQIKRDYPAVYAEWLKPPAWWYPHWYEEERLPPHLRAQPPS